MKVRHDLVKMDTHPKIGAARRLELEEWSSAR
jgi:hypothetical protein